MALGTQLIMILSLVIFFLNQFLEGSIGNYLSYFPYDVVRKLQLWRLFFSPLFAESFYCLLMSCLVIYNLLVEREKSQGTLLFLIELFFKSFLINILLTLFYFIELHTYLITYFYPQNGLWNLFFYYCTVRCQQNPDYSTNLFITNITIVNKYIPITMIVLFSIFSNPLGPIISTLFGFIDGKITQGAPCRFLWVDKLESKICISISSNKNFIKNSDAVQSDNYLQIFKYDLRELMGNPKIFDSLPVTINSNTDPAIEMNAQPNIERMLAYSKEQQPQEEPQPENKQLQQQPQDLL